VERGNYYCLLTAISVTILAGPEMGGNWRIDALDLESKAWAPRFPLSCCPPMGATNK